MKNYKITSFFGVSFLLATQLSMAQAPVDDFSLIKFYPNTADAQANQGNLYAYILKNNRNVSVDIKLETLSSSLHINPKFSNCRGDLPANGVCRFFVSFDAPNQLGQTTRFIKIESNHEAIKQALTFNVISKTARKSAIQESAINWQATSGPNGGQITDVLTSPTNPNTLYATAYGSGIYQSVDSGAHWTSINGDLTNHYLEKVVMNQGALFVVTYNGGIYKSIDQGAHWTLATNGLPNNYIYDLVADNTTLYAALFGGIYQSTDGGNTWFSTGSFPGGTAQTLLKEGSVMYVGTYNAGIYKSTDSGKTWVAVNNGAPDNNNITSIIDVKGILYAAGPNYQGKGAVIKSVDGGNNWTIASSGLGPCGVYNLAAQGDAVYASAFNASVTNKNQNGGIYKTTDGKTWVAVNNGIDFLYGMDVTTTDSTLYAGTIGALYQSTNGGSTWNEIDNGINGAWISSFVKTSTDIFAGTVTGAIYKSSDNGANWVLASKGINIAQSMGIANLVADDSNDVFALSIGPGVYKTDNAGASWSLVALPKEPYSSATVYPAAIYANKNTLYLGSSYDPVYYTNDAGTTWQTVTNESLNGMVSSLVSSNDLLYVARENLVVKTSLSDSQGWQSCKSLSSNIHRLLVDNNSLYAATVGGIYVSSNQGQDWTSLNNNGMPSNANVTNLIINESNMVASSTNYGIIASSDAGKTWSFANNGLDQSTYVYDILSDGQFIYAGTMNSVSKAAFPASH